MLVTDFTNTTNEPAFDGTLAQVLIGQLQQTPFLALFPKTACGKLWRLMARSPEERLTTDVRIGGLPAAGDQSVDRRVDCPAGADDMSITLDALDGQSGRPLAREQIEADTRIEVLPALGKIAIQLRQRLGEPFQSIERFNAPVERATDRVPRRVASPTHWAWSKPAEGITR